MRYSMFWRAKWTTDGATTIEEMAVKLEEAARGLREMAAAGITLESQVDDDYACLVTDNKKVAAKYGMQEDDEQ